MSDLIRFWSDVVRLLIVSNFQIFCQQYNVFHVSQIKKCLRVPKEVVEIEGLTLQPDLSYIEHPVKIFDEKESD